MTTIQVVGTCHHDCPDSCGWIATAEDGQLTKLEANPAHPYSQGELCPKVNRFVGRVNSPDRLLTPLIRTGAKGAGDFREASWDEALELVVAEVRSRVDAHGGETVLPWWNAGTQGLIQESALDRGFFAKLGSSRQIGNVCGTTANAGMAQAYGLGLGADALQMVHAELVILWGTNTRLTNRHLWPWVEEARANGARIVVVDPMRTITADAADDHIAPLPGTDLALLLAMAHVLVAENLIDRDYIARHAAGFTEFVASLAERTPEWAAPICGLDAETIAEFARSYGRAKPAMIRGLVGAEHHEQGAQIFRMLSLLPVMTGSWRHRGGGFSRSVGSWASHTDVDASVFDVGGLAPHPRRSLVHPRLGDSLTNPDLDPAVTALFVWGGNPLVSLPNTSLIRDGLGRDDLFTVVSEQFMTDTAKWADVVLPAAMQTETLDVVPAWGHLWLGWNEPAAPPPGEAVANTELWRRMSKAFGFTEPELFDDDETLIRRALGPHVDEAELRSTGFVRLTGTDDLMPYAEGGFHTSSGRAEFASDDLEQQGQPRIPTWIPAVETTAGGGRFPLWLQTPKKHIRFLNTSYSGLDSHADREAVPAIEMHESDAASRGLAAGDRARVHNDRGSLDLEVTFSDRLRPGVVSVAWGWWSGAYGDDTSVVNDLTNDTETDRGGGASYGDTTVEVTAI